MAWTALAAVATMGALLLLVPQVLGWGCTGEALKDPWLRKALRWVTLCAVVGLALNAAALVLTGSGGGAALTSVALVLAVRASSAWLKGRSILPSHEQN